VVEKNEVRGEEFFYSVLLVYLREKEREE